MLTENKRRFAYQVVTTADVDKAAEFIGIDRATADEWLNDPDVQAAIAHDTAAAVAVAGESRETIIARMVNWANADIGDYFEQRPVAPPDPDGNAEPDAGGWFRLKSPGQLTADQRKRIKKIKWTQHGPEIELHDPMRANRDLAEAYAIFENKQEDKRPEDWATQLRELAGEMEKVTSGATD
jgi:hypothetical protein